VRVPSRKKAWSRFNYPSVLNEVVVTFSTRRTRRRRPGSAATKSTACVLDWRARRCGQQQDV